MSEQESPTTAEERAEWLRLGWGSHVAVRRLVAQVESLEAKNAAIIVEQNTIVAQVHRLSTDRDMLREALAQMPCWSPSEGSYGAGCERRNGTYDPECRRCAALERGGADADAD